MAGKYGEGLDDGRTATIDTTTSSDAPTFAAHAAAAGDTKALPSGPIATPHAGKRAGENHGEFIEKPNYGPNHNTDTTLLQNPLAGMTQEDILDDVDRFVDAHGLSDERETFRKGALLARYNQDPYGFERVQSLTDGERNLLREEVEHKWRQPFALYFLVVLCAGSAIVQGMDQAAVNGAQQFYFDEFNIVESRWGNSNYVYIQGLLNGAPYACSALIGCWTNAPLNNWFGRRGTIFISCFISFAASFWMAAAPTWGVLLAGRFVLGLAVGAKSSTTPVFSSECAPKTIRGALTMQWQMWTAFGIMLGNVVSVAFQNTTAPTGAIEDVANGNYFYPQWRWMLGSTAIPPMIVMAQVYLCPESPRWYINRNRYTDAFKSFCRLRADKIQAARDLYYAEKQIQVEREEKAGKTLISEVLHNRRIRRGAQSAFFVMFMQQFCGVNVIAYYSTAIFEAAGFARPDALLVSLGTGITNWLFAIPAIYTIDTFGRRKLLMFGFPTMAIFLLWTGFSFYIDPEDPDSPRRVGMIAFGIFAFMACYSPSEGPVPFTYSSEAFPLSIRDTGMSFATATCWGFNFIISFTWPALSAAFTPTGAFGWYAAWNVFGTVYTYFLLPETKNLTLEELDTVFSVGNRQHASYYWHRLQHNFKRNVLRQNLPEYPPLVQINTGEDLSDKRQETASN